MVWEDFKYRVIFPCVDYNWAKVLIECLFWHHIDYKEDIYRGVGMYEYFRLIALLKVSMQNELLLMNCCQGHWQIQKIYGWIFICWENTNEDILAKLVSK